MPIASATVSGRPVVQSAMATSERALAAIAHAAIVRTTVSLWQIPRGPRTCPPPSSSASTHRSFWPTSADSLREGVRAALDDQPCPGTPRDEQISQTLIWHGPTEDQLKLPDDGK